MSILSIIYIEQHLAYWSNEPIGNKSAPSEKSLEIEKCAIFFVWNKKFGRNLQQIYFSNIFYFTCAKNKKVRYLSEKHSKNLNTLIKRFLNMLTAAHFYLFF